MSAVKVRVHWDYQLMVCFYSVKHKPYLYHNPTNVCIGNSRDNRAEKKAPCIAVSPSPRVSITQHVHTSIYA